MEEIRKGQQNSQTVSSAFSEKEMENYTKGFKEGVKKLSGHLEPHLSYSSNVSPTCFCFSAPAAFSYWMEEEYGKHDLGK